MNKQLFFSVLFAGSLLLFFASDCVGQKFDELSVRQELIKQGTRANEIEGLLKYKRIKFEEKVKNIKPAILPTVPTTSSIDCYNNDFEAGSTVGWNGCTGCNPVASSGTCGAGGSPCANPGMVAGRHTLTSGGGTDPSGGFPVVAPGGNFSFKLGDDNVGGEAEQMYKTFLVSSTNTNFTYQFAVVLEEPGHSLAEQPYFEAIMFDQNNDTIPCSYYHVAAGQGIPGFQSSSFFNDVIYRPWTSVYIDLTNYVGQNVTIRFTTADCSQGGHYGYAYVDAQCSQFEITSKVGCGNGAATLSAPIGAAKYVWSPGGETTQTKSVTTAGMYCVSMTSVQGCTKQLCYNFVPGSAPKPTASFNYNQTPCSKSITLADASATTVDTIKSWHWDFGDGSTFNSQAPGNHSYTFPGSYDITLIVKNEIGCSDSITQKVTVASGPVAKYTISNACVGTQVDFNDQSVGTNIADWLWKFGDGVTSGNPIEAHTYTSPGTFSTWLVIHDVNGCKDSVKKNITINPLPNPNFFSPDVCLNSKTAFKDQSTVTSGFMSAWLWDFGDGSTSSQANPSHTYTNSGTFNVKLTAISSNGCVKDTIKPVVVNPLPSASFSAANVCYGSTSTFSDASTIAFPDAIVNWKWVYGDGAPNSFAQNPSHAYSAPGAFNVKLVVTSNNGCIDTTTKNINVYALPVVSFGVSDTSGCAPLCLTFADSSSTSNGSIGTWQWNFGNGTSSISKNPTACYTSSGTYTVKLKATSTNGCSSTLTKAGYVTVHSLPTAEFTFGPQPVTVLEPLIQYVNTSSPDAIENYWYFGDGDSLLNPEEHDPSHYFNTDQPQKYTTQLVVMNQFGCKDTVEHQIIIGPDWSLYVPNAFTPNDDAKNDEFNAKGINILQYDMVILDRWGTVIFKTDDINRGWNGKVKNGSEIAQQDVYVYLINFKDVFNEKHKMNGHVTLVR